MKEVEEKVRAKRIPDTDSSEEETVDGMSREVSEADADKGSAGKTK